MKKEKAREKTLRAYDRIGPDYDSWYWTKRAQELRAGLTERVIEILQSELKTGNRKSRILDLCCGTGHLVDKISRLGSYTGLDFAPGMVEHCRRAYPKKEFVLAYAEDTPFDAGTFDAVVCFWSFHHILYPESVLDEIRRVLKPGGAVIIATFKDAGLNLMARFADALSSAYWGYVTRRYSKGEMEGLMGERFNSIEFEIFPKGRSLLNMLGIRFLIARGRK